MADVPQDDYAIEQPPEANLEQIEPEQRNAPPQLEGPNPPARVPHVRLRHAAVVINKKVTDTSSKFVQDVDRYDTAEENVKRQTGSDIGSIVYR
eukprot:CAMPEP_0184645334 /NCGR_PEP_ID=MMETSP0308-20130426/1812_1 /TAXON_ID=38269 /ORGANISM="Gloeochaete witrockiana, Strain SAG 46.84" /LENGTH=93 /DNA_ID=CAMNT_0027074247 /DNA_START=99 /DNA_END=381 /DNA_ORIENTATION=+